MTKIIAIVTPVLDDWVSFAALAGEISDLFTGSEFTFRIYAVDDGSTQTLDVGRLNLPADSCILSIEVIRLAANLGHQRAIAVGLSAIAESGDIDAVMVMDSDGQDRPTDVAPLLAAISRQPQHIVLAGRTKRSEPCLFRIFYHLYRISFHVLTGEPIGFGNFCLLPIPAVRRLVHMPELWNNLAASIMRSRIFYATVPTIRGRRVAGCSKMSFACLIVHGLAALSVYIDRILVRLLLAASAAAGATGLGVAAVAGIRFGTDLAVPGWATAVVGGLVIILVQILVVVTAASLTVLAGRSHRPFIPIVDYPPFVEYRERLRPRGARATTKLLSPLPPAA
jgi:hypothetical protein